jgi:hypothetical protein
MRHLAAVVFLFLLASKAAACGSGQPDPFYPLSVLRQQIETLVHQRAYKELDRLALEYRHSDALTSNGEQKLLALHSALAPMRVCPKGKAAALAAISRHRKLVIDWQKHSAVPETAGIALARLERAIGWRKRGNGFADTVTPEGWKALHDHANRAADMLDNLGQAGRKDPAWYVERLETGRDQGWERAQVDALYREAIAAFPNYTPLYYFKADFVSARWGGSRDQFHAFVDEAERSPANKHGPGILYTRLQAAYWSDEMRKQPHMDRFRQGFQHLVARYPDVYNNNWLAYFGCKGAGVEVLHDQLAIIGDRISLSVWGNKKYAAACKAFALKGMPAIEKEKKERAARRAARLARPPEPVAPEKKFLGLF